MRSSVARLDGALALPTISSHSFLLVLVPLMTLTRLLRHLVPRTARNRDRRGLFEAEPVLRDETRGHREFGCAEVPGRRQRRIRSLWESQVEHSYRDVGEVPERAARNSAGTDKRFAMQIDG